MNLSLEGKTAVVCGSTQGIGLATAEELAALGATCIMVARNKSALEDARGRLSASSHQKHSYAVADFTHTEEIRKVIHDIVEQQSVHILINNTGGPKGGPITEAKEEEFINGFNQHLIGNHILTTSVVPSMKKEGYGRIINIISTSVRIPLKNLGVSNTIRGAVASWAKTMSNELAEFNITVNNILPGFTATQRLKSLIHANAQKAKVDESMVEQQMVAEIPAGRFGTAHEVAAVAAFLATPAAAYVNGVSIPVDGGRTGTI
jgi:3-oxoacyl-[acyl-carrier protein] reductase